MSGNATYRLNNAAILSVSAVEPPRVVTSAEFDERLAATYARTGMQAGMLEKLAGVRERRWWPEDFDFTEAATLAGAKALAEAGIDPSAIGVLINTSVTRAALEPAVAVSVHAQLGLPTGVLNFDVANACLGFVNAMQLAGTMIDADQVEYALIVDAEGIQGLQQLTLDQLASEDASAEDVKLQFATLTLGCGAAAMVLGPADRHPEGHQIVGGASRAGSEHHALCIGSLERMRTDSRKLFEAGIALAAETWRDALSEFDWAGADRFVAHQTSVAHLEAMAAVAGADVAKFPMTMPAFGNIGPASVPFTLAQEVDSLHPGDQVVLIGIGSGLNTSFAEITW